MNNYDITITEVFSKTVKVKADSYKEAKQRVEELYFDADLILTNKDFKDVEFT